MSLIGETLILTPLILMYLLLTPPHLSFEDRGIPEPAPPPPLGPHWDLGGFGPLDTPLAPGRTVMSRIYVTRRLAEQKTVIIKVASAGGRAITPRPN